MNSIVGVIPNHAFFSSSMLLRAFVTLGIAGSSMLIIGNDGLEVPFLSSVITIIGITGVISILILILIDMPPTRHVQSKGIGQNAPRFIFGNVHCPPRLRYETDVVNVDVLAENS
jgi:hypothetical protein